MCGVQGVSATVVCRYFWRFTSFSSHSNLRSPPSPICCSSPNPAAHTLYSTWPSKPSWPPLPNVLTSERVRKPAALISLPDTDQPNSCDSLVAACTPAVTNLPLIRPRRSNRCSNPRSVGIQPGTIELSLWPPSTPHRFPLITGRGLGRLQPDILQGPSKLFTTHHRSHFQPRLYHATSPSSPLESKFFPLLVPPDNPLHVL